MKRSFRVRLLVWLLALLVPLSIGAAWLLIEVFGNRLVHDLDVALQEEAETVGELLVTPTQPQAISALLERIAGDTEQGLRKYITVTRGTQVIAEVPPGAHAVMSSGDPRLRIARYESPDHSLTVAIAVSPGAALHAKRRLTSLLAIGIPLVLALGALGLLLVTGRALRPLEEASRQLEAVAADNLSVRIPVENPDDEVGRMVTVLNRMLDRLQRAVGELKRFTGDAAHELRTPLTVLRTGLDLAQSRERPADEYRAALQEALLTTDRLGRLTEDLLTLARLDAAGARRSAGTVDLGETMHELAAAWQADAGSRPLAVQVTAEPGCRVRGDAGELFRLFNNLIDNARRYGVGRTAADAEITVSTRRVGDQIETQVADRGPGMPMEDLARVFDRFYRGNGAGAAQPGTGLGLSIAQEIARAHGGRITAANRDGGGSVFTVTLPASV